MDPLRVCLAFAVVMVLQRNFGRGNNGNGNGNCNGNNGNGNGNNENGNGNNGNGNGNNGNGNGNNGNDNGNNGNGNGNNGNGNGNNGNGNGNNGNGNGNNGNGNGNNGNGNGNNGNGNGNNGNGNGNNGNGNQNCNDNETAETTTASGAQSENNSSNDSYCDADFVQRTVGSFFSNCSYLDISFRPECTPVFSVSPLCEFSTSQKIDCFSHCAFILECSYFTYDVNTTACRLFAAGSSSFWDGCVWRKETL